MSQRWLRLTLWLLLVATIPVRYQLADSELAPPLRLIFLTAMTLLLHLSEGYGGNLWAAMLALGVAQSALYLFIFYALAAFAARQLAARISPPVATLVVAVFATALLVSAVRRPHYVTPISSQHMYSSLVDVFR